METVERPTVRRPRVSLWPLRVVLTAHLLAVLAQPVLAGRFLTGDVDAIGWHADVGSSLAAIARRSRRTSSAATTQIAKPPRAKAAPTYPVEAQP